MVHINWTGVMLLAHFVSYMFYNTWLILEIQQTPVKRLRQVVLKTNIVIANFKIFQGDLPVLTST